jgi:hypothetical protein
MSGNYLLGWPRELNHCPPGLVCHAVAVLVIARTMLQQKPLTKKYYYSIIVNFESDFNRLDFG